MQHPKNPKKVAGNRDSIGSCK